VLLGDVGATNARFAICVAGKVSPIEWIDVASHPHFSDALGQVLLHFNRGKVTDAILAVAGPVDRQCCRFTNCTWTVNGPQLCDRFGFKSVHLVNDFYATAKSLPLLEADHLVTLGSGSPIAGAPCVVLGPGSGLGVAALIADGTVVTSEGGHATFAGASRREDAVLDYIRKQYGHVSAERVLSGPGIETLYTAVAHVDGMRVPARNAVQVTDAALSDECPVSVATIDLFWARQLRGKRRADVWRVWRRLHRGRHRSADYHQVRTIGLPQPFRGQGAPAHLPYADPHTCDRPSDSELSRPEIACGSTPYETTDVTLFARRAMTRGPRLRCSGQSRKCSDGADRHSSGTRSGCPARLAVLPS
jgi:glucokinase